MLTRSLGKLAAGQDLSLEEMSAAIGTLMDGQASEQEIGLFLTALAAKGETVDEVAGAAAAMRGRVTPIRSERTSLIDTCGTGGDQAGLFNVSTAAAIVTAAAGAPVAKHGNRRVTSRTGSADALRELGVNIEADVPTVEACLDELGLCFCFAPLLHSAMKHVAPVRQKLGIPTVFNLLGPLTNPAGAPFQLVGVAREDRRLLLASALVRLGARRALVVRGEDGLDEVTLAGATRVTEATPAGTREFTWTPQDFGLAPQPLDSIRAADAAESANIIRGVLAGEPGPAREIVILNAAAALWTVGHASDPQACAQVAAAAIDQGAARNLLDRLRVRSRGAGS